MHSHLPKMWLWPVVFFCCFENLMSDNITQEDAYTVPDKDWRINGGVAAKLSRTPWMAILLAEGQHMCGGSIIRPNKILTAAHCVSGVPTKVLSVRIGSSMWQKGGVVLKVTKSAPHAKFDRFILKNDIAILTVSPKIKFKKGSISQVNLPSSRQSFSVGKLFTLVGFGTTSENGESSPRLLSAKIPFVSHSECKKVYAHLTTDMLCAGFEHGRKNACKGDSGGPLTSGKTQVGIVSFGGYCAEPMKYIVYAKVSYFMKWIKRNIK